MSSTVAILTNMMDFLPGYSLSGIMKDQITMLTSYGHDVKFFVNESYKDPTDFGPKVEVIKKIPFTHLKDYHSKNELSPEHRLIVEKTAAMLIEELKGINYVFTHDFAFIGWFLPYGLACAKAGAALPDARWFHWIHSVPTAMSDWWDIHMYGKKHKIIYPNDTDRIRVAEQYRGEMNDVRTIPHIKDLRTWFDFSPDTCAFIDSYPSIMQSSIVQVYPASVDRLEGKRVKEVIKIFSNFKNMGHSVCLVLATQWATGEKQIAEVNRYKQIAVDHGLEPDVDIIFSPFWNNGKWKLGIPKRELRELFQCSSVFIFPTREESFGLVLPEAALAGGVFCVVNKSLQMQTEVSGMTAVAMDFGSYYHTHNVADQDRYYRDLAWIIAGRMLQNEAVQTKMFMRQMYNWDNLYRKFYAPVMAESDLW